MSTKLRTILRYLGTCDGDMEKGNLRADVNVSVRRPGEPLGTRCEIKNVNSIRFIGQAIEAEARRQIGIIEDGGTIDQETRLFDPGQGRDPLDALEGGGARLPLFPRPRPAAARIRPGLRRRPREGPAGTAGRQEGALHRRLRPLGLRRRRARGRAGVRRFLRGGREGARRQGRGELGDQRAVRPPQQGGPATSRASPVSAGAARRHHRPHRRGRDLGQDRQGPVRDRLDRGRRSARRSSRRAA